MLSFEMKDWGFEEQTHFEGLMPKTMEVLGDDYCVGVTGEEPVLSVYNPTAKGTEQMKVVSPYKIMTNESTEESSDSQENGENTETEGNNEENVPTDSEEPTTNDGE